MGVITLEGLTFFAYHGHYPEEREKGNEFNVDVTLEVDFPKAAETDDLQFTIDYQDVYKIVTEEMETPSKLLEHVAYRILQKIHLAFPQVHAAGITVAKRNPPIGGPCHQAKVTISEDFRA